MCDGPWGDYNSIVIYLFYSAEPELARRSALKTARENFPDRNESNFICFNMAETPLKTLTSECEFLPLGCESKAVVAENCSFLAKPPRKVGAKAPKKEKKTEPELAIFASYCQNPNPQVDLYLVVYSEQLDDKNPAVSAISKTGKILPLPIPDEQRLIAAAFSFFQKNKCPAEKEACREFVQRVGGDYGRYLSEREKLCIYANGEPITLNVVQKLVSPRLEENTFEMSNALLRGDTGRAFSIYKDLKVQSADEIRLINMLATQLRFLEQIQFLFKNGRSEDSIARELNVKPYRVAVSLRSLRAAGSDSLIILQEELYETEKSILSGLQTPEFAFERLLANFSLGK